MAIFPLRSLNIINALVVPMHFEILCKQNVAIEYAKSAMQIYNERVERLVRLFAQLMDLLCYHTKSSLICMLKERSLTFQHIACIEIAAASGKVP